MRRAGADAFRRACIASGDRRARSSSSTVTRTSPPNAFSSLRSVSIIRNVVGNQIGPRQLLLPPLSIDVASRRLVADRRAAEGERMLLVKLAQAAHAVRREELVRIDDAREQMLQLVLIDDREHVREVVVVAARSSRSARRCRGGACRNQSRFSRKTRERLDPLSFQPLDGVERNRVRRASARGTGRPCRRGSGAGRRRSRPPRPTACGRRRIIFIAAPM